MSDIYKSKFDSQENLNSALDYKWKFNKGKRIHSVIYKLHQNKIYLLLNLQVFFSMSYNSSSSSSNYAYLGNSKSSKLLSESTR